MPDSRGAQWGLLLLGVLTVALGIYAAAIRPIEIANEKLAAAVIVSDTRIKELEIKVAVLEDRAKR